MTIDRSMENLISLVRELCKLPRETEWVEFKENYIEPQDIGEYISAISNSSALLGKPYGYLLWGVRDEDHEIVGTNFSPAGYKKGNEQLENWLLQLLAPKIHFRFYEFQVDGKNLTLLEIASAFRHPVQFQGQEYLRIGSQKRKLKDFPEKERELWRVFDQTPYERMVAVENIGEDEVLRLLDYPAYFDLLKTPLPATRAGILEALANDEMITKSETGQWNVTNLGAILFAKQLSGFKSLHRKVVRLIVYKGNSRVETIREQDGTKGYAVGFEGLIDYIKALLPSNEVIEKTLRKTVSMYPEPAIRELVANALIHQDFSITGSGPMIEIFGDRMEITNPGKPLVKTERFLDSPPRSRNEVLAAFMRRVGVCEERGSGVDKVVSQTELYQLPAPVFEVVEDNTKAILFSHRPLSKMDKGDRVRACYLHACLRYVNHDFMTNTSLRERFGIEPQNIATASRYIKEAVEDEVIRPFDEDAAPKLMKYVPFWVQKGS